MDEDIIDEVLENQEQEKEDLFETLAEFFKPNNSN